jgi:hypothetical protein
MKYPRLFHALISCLWYKVSEVKDRTREKMAYDAGLFCWFIFADWYNTGRKKVLFPSEF